MNRMMTMRCLWVAAAVLLFAGAGMTIRNLSGMNEVFERLRKKTVELKDIRELESELGRYEAAKQKAELSGDKKPVLLLETLQEADPGIKGDDIRDQRREATPGWVVRQKEITLNDVAIGKAMEVARKAESQEPSWCVARCTVRVSPRSSGSGQVVLLMEAVEKVGVNTNSGRRE